jgi:hypothetical protein
MQTAVNDWPQAVALLPAGTWCKAVSEQGLCREIKQTNPGVKVVFRYEYNPHQHLQGDYHELARVFFRAFIDGTFYSQEYYRHIEAIEEWNEYLANSQDAEERGRWLAWCRAVNEVWTNEYRTDPRLAHIRLVSCNTAIGNDIGSGFARVVQEHGGILGYHNYTVVRNGVIPEGEDWQYYSGRWTAMDRQYRAQGITVPWLFTEGGACTIGSVDGEWYSGVTEGWKHPKNYNGNLPAYLQGVIKYQIDRCATWKKANGGRALGHALFTTHRDPGIWGKFALFAPEMKDIAQFVRDYAPGDVLPPPPPPPVDDWKPKAWAESVSEQIARGIPLNPNAALLAEIYKAGMVPVHREIIVDGRTLQAAESLSGSPARRVYVWQAGKPVTWFGNPS